MALVGVLAAAACSDDTSSSPEGLQIGLQDDRLVHLTQKPEERFAMIDRVNAKLVRVDVRWDMVASDEPRNPRDHNDPAYKWGIYDGIVEQANKNGVRLLFAVWGTPSWARDQSKAAIDSERYPQQPFGARPLRPADAGEFAEAAAARYGPRGVKMWEAWNEPNGPLFLRPQYVKKKGKWVPEAPRVYAQIASAMYEGFKKGDPEAIVAGGVTAPVGNGDLATCTRQPNCRMTPQAFVEHLSKPGLQPPMDAFAHHPYPLRPPSDRVNPKASYIDLYSLSELEKVLDAGYLKDTPLWLTEFGIATRRVRDYAYYRTEAEQEEHLRDALRRVRQNPRVKVFIWYLLQDHANWASGLFAEDGREKPSAEVFRKAVS